MSLEIIELDDFDLPLLYELIDLQKEAFGVMGLNEGTLPLMIRYGRVFLLKKEQEIVGSAEVMRDWSNSGCVFLIGFSIKRGHRKKGMGKVFLKEILRRLRAQASRVKLTVSPENKAAFNLYKNLGFEEVRFCKDEYGLGEDRLLMELSLKE